MNWNNLKYFFITVETGSLTAASNKLGVSTATVGRHIDKLQAELGVSLMRRGRNGIVLSKAGELLSESTAELGPKLYELERLASTLSHGRQKTPVRISSTEPIIADILAPSLPDLYKQDASIRVEFLSSTTIANLDQQEADLAIRLFRPEGDSLLVKRLPDIQMACFASKKYLKGKNLNDLDLKKESLLVLSEVYGKIAEVMWVHEQSLQSSVVLWSTSTRALIEAAKDGLGIAIAAKYQGNRNNLVEVPAKRIANRQAWLISHRETRKINDINVVKNWIASSFANALN